MRRIGENFVAHFILKPAGQRLCDDQAGDTDRDADHGNDGGQARQAFPPRPEIFPGKFELENHVFNNK